MLTIAQTAAAVLSMLVPLAGTPAGLPETAPTTPLSAQPEAELPSAESLFDAHIEATGGLAAHKKAKNRVYEGVYRLLAQDDTQIIRIYMEAPNKFRAEVEAPALGTTLRCTNGETAWGMNLSGKSFVLEPRETAEINDNALFLGEAAYDQRYTSLKTESRTTLDNRDAYRVAFETRTGVKGAVYFDADTKLLMAREVTSATGQNSNVIVLVSDYRESDGVLIPMVQRQRFVNQKDTTLEIEFRSVKSNVNDLPSFDPPADLMTNADEG